MPSRFIATLRPLLATTGLVALLAITPAHLASAANLDVPYVPTPQEVVDRMLALGEVKADDYLIDLGSGDGRIPVTAAKRFGSRALGVDLNPVRIQEAQANAREAGVTDKVQFKEQNLFDTPIGEANVLTMYLLPSVNIQLRPRILNELAPGSRVVSHAFDMQDWQPDHQEMVDGRTVYLWIVPAKVEGLWKVQGDKPFTLDLKQRFQAVEGTASIDGKPTTLTDVRLRGKQLEFTLDGKRHSVTVDGNTMTAKQGGWRATRT